MAELGDAAYVMGVQLEAGRHPCHLSTVTMMGAATPRAVQAHYSWARSRGYGAENWSPIIDAIRPYA